MAIELQMALNRVDAGVFSYRSPSLEAPQNCYFQYQRHTFPIAGTAGMVRARRARCGLLTRTESTRRSVSASRHQRGWLRSHLAWADIVERSCHSCEEGRPAGKKTWASRWRQRHA